MKSFFVIVFHMGCSSFVDCDHTSGEVLNADGSYIPGSALMWADLAQQSIRYSDPVGYHLVQYWISEIDASNSDMENTSDPNPILKFFKTFAKMTGRLSTHINRNPALAHCFAIITRELGKLLKVKKDENTLDTLNSYMIDTYPRIKSAMNSK